MGALSGPRPRRRALDRAELALVAGLLILHAALALASAVHKSAVFDEPAHLAGGLLAWQGDYRFNAESGVLAQRWTALPGLIRPLDLGAPDDPARQRANVWQIGRQVLYGPGHDGLAPDGAALLRAARAMNAVWSAVLGLAVYLWSRALFGRAGAALSLLLYALSPTVLAHARLATADLPAALFFLLALAAVWRLCQRLDAPRLLTAALAVAGLLLVKHSGLLILPTAIALAAVRLARRRPLPAVWRGRRRRIVSGPRQAAALAGAAVLAAVVVWGAVWAAYGGRFAADPRAADATEGSRFLHGWDEVLAGAGAAGPAIDLARRLQLLPEAYLWGVAYTLDTTRERDAFLAGRTGTRGWWWFFPYAAAVKTPPALFALLALALAAGVRARRRTGRALYRVAPLLALLAVYGGAAVASHLNIGHRHLLPLYPALFVLAGGAASWISRRTPVRAAAVVAAAALFAVGSAWIYPHYLAYFSPLAGGPRHGYRHLVDSSLDWGQDLPALADRVTELRRRGEGPVYAAYFGTAVPDPERFRDVRWLYSYFPVADPATPPAPLRGGVYAVSATLLQSVHLECLGPWTAARERRYRELGEELARFLALYRDAAGRERLARERPVSEWMELFRDYDRLRCARLFKHLLRREPFARAGYSILLFRLSDAEVAEALTGPPPYPVEPSLGGP